MLSKLARPFSRVAALRPTIGLVHAFPLSDLQLGASLFDRLPSGRSCRFFATGVPAPVLPTGTISSAPKDSKSLDSIESRLQEIDEECLSIPVALTTLQAKNLETKQDVSIAMQDIAKAQRDIADTRQEIADIKLQMVAPVDSARAAVLSEELKSSKDTLNQYLQLLNSLKGDLKSFRDDLKSSAKMSSSIEKSQVKFRLEKERLLRRKGKLIAQRRQFLMDDRQPLQFQPVVLDGQTMMVAASVPNVHGPMFLTPSAHESIEDFIADFQNKNQSLFIVGPPKSSKSTVMKQVLPGMVFSLSKDVFSPVFVSLSFRLDDTPASALTLLYSKLVDIAENFDVPRSHRPIHKSGDYVDVVELVREICCAFELQRRRLWFLIDELQAPLIKAPNLDAQVRFELMFKEILDVGDSTQAHPRLVVTGSGMLTTLNIARTLKPNGFHFFNCINAVKMGLDAPSDIWAQKIASDVMTSFLSSRSSNAQLMKNVKSQLTVPLLLYALRQRPNFLNVRPALICFLMVSLSSKMQSIKRNLSGAVEKIVTKISIESKPDFEIALASAFDFDRSDPLLIWLSVIANHHVSSDQEQSLIEQQPMSGLVKSMLQMLCETDDHFAKTGVPDLLPPYRAMAVSTVQNQDGSISLSRQFNNKIQPFHYQDIQNFNVLVDLFGKGVFTRATLMDISNCVMQSLADHGHGILDPSTGLHLPAASVFDVPSLSDLYRLSLRPALTTTLFDKKLAAHLLNPNKLPDSTDFLVPIEQILYELAGIVAARALRHGPAHGRMIEIIKVCGISSSHFQSVVSAVVKVALASNSGMSMASGFLTHDTKTFRGLEEQAQAAAKLSTTP